MPSAPSPPAPIKELVAIKVQRRQSQRFDVTGLLSMSAVRYTPGQLLIRGAASLLIFLLISFLRTYSEILIRILLSHRCPGVYGNTAKGLQAIADLSLCDEPKTPEGKNAVIEFTFYVPCEEKGTAPLLMQDMPALIDKPVSMFSLTTKNTDGCYDVYANDEFFFKPAAGPKADALTASAAELQSLPSENKHKLT